jgi:hypothetical protein
MPHEPASAEAQRRLRRVAGKLLGEQVRYHTESLTLGMGGETVRTAGLGEVLSVTDRHVTFTGPDGEDVVGLGDLRSIEIDAATHPREASISAAHPDGASVDQA